MSKTLEQQKEMQILQQLEELKQQQEMKTLQNDLNNTVDYLFEYFSEALLLYNLDYKKALKYMMRNAHSFFTEEDPKEILEDAIFIDRLGGTFILEECHHNTCYKYTIMIGELTLHCGDIGSYSEGLLDGI